MCAHGKGIASDRSRPSTGSLLRDALQHLLPCSYTAFPYALFPHACWRRARRRLRPLSKARRPRTRCRAIWTRWTLSCKTRCRLVTAHLKHSSPDASSSILTSVELEQGKFRMMSSRSARFDSSIFSSSRHTFERFRKAFTSPEFSCREPRQGGVQSTDAVSAGRSPPRSCSEIKPSLQICGEADGSCGSPNGRRSSPVCPYRSQAA